MTDSLPPHAVIRERQSRKCVLRYLADPMMAEPYALSGVLSEVGERGERGGYEQFSLMFHAEEGSGAHQGMYAVDFDDGVRWNLFLVPVQRDGTQIAYEACFNRAVQA